MAFTRRRFHGRRPFRRLGVGRPGYQWFRSAQSDFTISGTGATNIAILGTGQTGIAAGFDPYAGSNVGARVEGGPDYLVKRIKLSVFQAMTTGAAGTTGFPYVLWQGVYKYSAEDGGPLPVTPANPAMGSNQDANQDWLDVWSSSYQPVPAAGVTNFTVDPDPVYHYREIKVSRRMTKWDVLVYAYSFVTNPFTTLGGTGTVITGNLSYSALIRKQGRGW